MRGPRKDSIISVRLTADQAEELQRLATRLNITVSALLRRGAHAVIADSDLSNSATAMALRHHERREWGRFEPDVTSNCGGPASCPVCRSRGVIGSLNATPFEFRLVAS